ncbi:unnamed protein product [Rotaria socialis]|uniref:BTB domain-containing protein n=1 Tax=Rotaria socialis TaxID=392032 RepID=A0A820YQZ7_9BILA|nr:unnamed protein product [Rotaria socialis]CAF4552890.1 unnamed protein product [Rotaria socialis]
MLKRSRSKSESSGSDSTGKTLLSTMSTSTSYSGDRKRSCVFTTDACQILNELRKNNMLCDAKISSKKHMTEESVKFPIHRFILAASSPYFHMAFTNMQHSENLFLQLDIEYDALESLLDYIYTRKCSLTLDNVNRIIDAAKLCQMTSLFQYCCEYLRHNLNDDNIFYLYNFAKMHSNSKLSNATYEYLMRHFIEITKINKSFLKLSIEELIGFISNNDLNVRNEEILFSACIKWIDYDTEKRKSFIARLIRNLRLGLIPLQLFMTKIKQHSYIKDNDECKPIVGETLRLLYKLDNNGLMDADIDCPFIRPRHAHEMIFAYGGWSGGNATNMLEAYDIRADKWVVISTDQVPPRAYHGCITVGNKMYVIGGFDGTEYFNSCRTFNLIDRVWNEIAPMNERRCYVSIAYLNGLLYAMGGFNGHVRQSTAEKYLFETNQWSTISPMRVQRSDASACTLNDLVYICGGFDGQECLQTAEYYNPITNQWTMIQPMNSRRSGVGVITYHGFIYAIGGFNGTSRLSTGERYNPNMNILDDLMFAIGGFNGLTTVSNVECYDDKTSEWYDIADMNLFRSALSACIVDGLTYTKIFLHSNDTSMTNSYSTSFVSLSTIRTIPSLAVGLPSVPLTSHNQSLRNFSHSRIQ